MLAATIKDGCSLGAYISVLFDAKKEFGKKRVKIKGEIDGIYFKRLICSIIPFGNIIVLKNNILKNISKQTGGGLHMWI
ncbi:MAG TPA: DUF1905 domain-containing protein [Bacteroidetes bacterium]|nr:DUF1905 domain-containing protein [Bacteroidota bacterium]